MSALPHDASFRHDGPKKGYKGETSMQRCRGTHEEITPHDDAGRDGLGACIGGTPTTDAHHQKVQERWQGSLQSLRGNRTVLACLFKASGLRNFEKTHVCVLRHPSYSHWLLQLQGTNTQRFNEPRPFAPTPPSFLVNTFVLMASMRLLYFQTMRLHPREEEGEYARGQVCEPAEMAPFHKTGNTFQKPYEPDIQFFFISSTGIYPVAALS